MPYVTEVLYDALGEKDLISSAWPKAHAELINEEAEKQYAEYQILGRSFLNICGVKLISDDISKNEVSVESCSNNNSLLNTIASYMNNFYF